jgi:hypothetical protein
MVFDKRHASTARLGSLPLLSAVLDGLHREDAEKSGNRHLTYGTYAQLGKLSGAIAKRADEVLARVFAESPLERRGDLETRALARILRGVATTGVSEDGAVTARTAALDGFATHTPERQLVEAMLAPASRLLVADSAGGEVRIRVAHEALLTNWERARRQLAVDRRDLETRARIEQAAALWRAATPGEQPRRLLRDLALAEAEDLRARWGDELEVSLLVFIAASTQSEQARIAEAAEQERRQRELEAEQLRVLATAAEQRAAASQRLARRTAIALIGAFALVTLAVAGGVAAWDQKNRAEMSKSFNAKTSHVLGAFISYLSENTIPEDNDVYGPLPYIRGEQMKWKDIEILRENIEIWYTYSGPIFDESIKYIRSRIENLNKNKDKYHEPAEYFKEQLCDTSSLSKNFLESSLLSEWIKDRFGYIFDKHAHIESFSVIGFDDFILIRTKDPGYCGSGGCSQAMLMFELPGISESLIGGGRSVATSQIRLIYARFR